MERASELKVEISRRLRRALEKDNRSIRSLESAMSARGSDITSYGAIRAYIKGEKLPPLTFLMEAADELSVRPEWLILGEGGMTTSEQKIATDEEEELRAKYPETENWPADARRVLLGLHLACIYQAPDHLEAIEVGKDVSSGVQADLVFLATLPLRGWGFTSLEDMSEHERHSYLMMMLTALRLAVKGHRAGDSMLTYADGLLPALRRMVEKSS